MLPKNLLALLILPIGFALSGVSAFVIVNLNTDEPIYELTAVSSVDERKEVRIEVIPSKILIDIPVELFQNQDFSDEVKEDKDYEEEPSLPVKIVQAMDVADIVPKRAVETEESPVDVPKVPFYSQFNDITPPNWKKVSCGIAGVAMLIDFYSDEAVSADKLLQQGISADAFLSDAGWTHQGLINLTKQFGLNGQSHSFSGLSMDAAFMELKTVLEDGPVMASVHYTFQPTNPIPHLVVVNGVKDGKVFYNDPAEESGGGSISIAQFQSAWKKRYIEIRPVL